MNASKFPRREREKAYFALGIALLISVVASALVISLRTKLARVQAESVLFEDREDFAIARQLERVVHDSVQRVAGQEKRLDASTTDISTEISNRLATVLLPWDSRVLVTSVSNPEASTFFPETTSAWTRIPAGGGKLAAADLPYGGTSGLLQNGYYVPTTAEQTFTFTRLLHEEPKAGISVTASYRAIPLTSQRLILFNYSLASGGSRPSVPPELTALDPDHHVNGLINTQFTTAAGIIDSENAPGAGESMAYYRHRTQVVEEIFQYLFKGDYLDALKSGAVLIGLSDIGLALEPHEGLYTQEQETTPDAPVTESKFKMDVSHFSYANVVYFSDPLETPVEITLLDSAHPTDQAIDPIVVVFDGQSGPGSFKLRFEEFIHRPILFVLRSTTVEFSGSTSAPATLAAGAIAGAFLMDDDSGFATDGTDSASTRMIYGAVLGHHELLNSGFVGANNHPVPVMEFPDSTYYDYLELVSPRALVVETRSQLISTPSPDAYVLVP